MAYHRSLRGRDLHAPSQELVVNNTGATISKLKGVVFDGMAGAPLPYPQIALAPLLSSPIAGITLDDVDNGKPTYICCLGFIYEVDTSMWAVNDRLYVTPGTGDLTTVAIAGQIPIGMVIKSDALTGVLYIDNTIGISSIAAGADWSIIGNLGTDDDVHFIGTTDTASLRIRTNNNHAASFDEMGRFGIGPDILDPSRHVHIKSHVDYPGSGLQIETFALISTSATSVPAYSVTVADQSVVRVEFTVTARQADGSERAMFKRTGVFFRESSNVQILKDWLSDQTLKSHLDFNVDYTMGVGNVTFTVKNAHAVSTYWHGHVKIEAIGANI